MRWWNNPEVVSKTPLVAIPLFCWFSLWQIWQMWSERTAAGQNLWGWISLTVALIGFLNFYRVCCPKEKLAYWGIVVEIVIESAAMLTVVYFQYFVGR